jgi:ubiquinone/menaquinone biosynthesis C-methylase UbiE
MLPTTSQLLKTVGLRQGMECLDVGCNGGHVSLLMASMIGPAGKVVGTDTDQEILELAKEDAEIAKTGNVEFRQVDACLCQSHEDYDLVYARFLLSHLREPEKCLETMVEACRPGGIIVVEDVDFAGSFCYPIRAAYERYVELYQKVVARKGGDPNIGPKLPGMRAKRRARDSTQCGSTDSHARRGQIDGLNDDGANIGRGDFGRTRH